MAAGRDKGDRQERLADALRQNLKRRKAAARARAQAEEPLLPAEPTPTQDDGIQEDKPASPNTADSD